MPDVDGHPVTSAMGTQALWNIYPGEVRRWINRHGGLSRKMIYLQGRELSSVVAICGGSQQARSERRTPSKPVRYESANAASDRR